MAEPKAKAFQHVDGGLREQLQANVVDTDRPMMERMLSGIALIAARGLLDEANKTGLTLPGMAPAPAPVPNALPSPKPEE
ncbi:MAG TPA: hypothetical protein VE993_01570 [Stellaceae bacterium]|nr:hypothetical protein [Stellaceae bacterium]